MLTLDDFEYVGSFRLPPRVGEGGAGFSESGLALRKMQDGTKRLLVNYTHPRQVLFEVEIPELIRFEQGDDKPLKTAQVRKIWGTAAYPDRQVRRY